MSTKRKLAAILSADAAGYSKLMADDDAATLCSLNDARALFRERIEAHGGRLVDTAGDNVLAEFPSAIEAVGSAVEIQHELAKRNALLAEDRRMQFRIGINLGDVIEQEDGTIYGDGVNVAARLQTLAEPGGICVSGTTFDHVEGKLSVEFKFIGQQQVKNIAKPVRVYRARVEKRAEAMSGKTARRRKWVWPAIAVAALLGTTAAVGLWRSDYFHREPPQEDPILAMPKGPSIAVLPFANLSGDPNQDYFSDGLTEQLITALARYRELYVIARNSTFQYKGQSVDVRKVGRELGVRYVLEGSVRRSGKTLRVTAQLLDARSGAHLWAETYDRTLTGADIFALQDDITSNAVANIAGPHGRISQARLEETKGKAPDSIDSYDCVLRAGAWERASLSLEGHGPIRDCLEKAVARDPNYAKAWAWLALIYLDEYQLGFNPRPELYDARDRALEAGLRAVELDPNSAVAHTNLSWIRFFRHELDASLASAERAVALNPNDPEVLCLSGLPTAYAGKWERGIALTRKAMALSPNYPRWCHFAAANYHYLKAEYEQALAEALKIELPGFFWTQVILARNYGQLGRKEEASMAVARLLKLYPDIAANYRRDERKYNFTDDQIEHFVEGMRKAGLDIPPE